MDLTRAARPLPADSRRGFASVLTVMFLVLAVLGVQAVCGVHPHEADHGAGHGSTRPYTAVGQQVPTVVTPSGQPAQSTLGHHGEGSNHCAEDRTVTARYDRTLSPLMDMAGAPSLALRWLVPDIAHHGVRTPAGLAVAAAPSLHALGISRT